MDVCGLGEGPGQPGRSLFPAARVAQLQLPPRGGCPHARPPWPLPQGPSPAPVPARGQGSPLPAQVCKGPAGCSQLSLPPSVLGELPVPHLQVGWRVEGASTCPSLSVSHHGTPWAGVGAQRRWWPALLPHGGLASGQHHGQLCPRTAGQGLPHGGHPHPTGGGTHISEQPADPTIPGAVPKPSSAVRLDPLGRHLLPVPPARLLAPPTPPTPPSGTRLELQPPPHPEEGSDGMQARAREPCPVWDA